MLSEDWPHPWTTYKAFISCLAIATHVRVQARFGWRDMGPGRAAESAHCLELAAVSEPSREHSSHFPV